MVVFVTRWLWLGFLVLGFTSPALAAELQWEAPEGCPDVHALERESEQQLGEPLAPFPLNVVGSVTREDAQLRLSLRITLPQEAETRERELQAASCQELLEAAAVAIALAAAESGERGPIAVAQTRDQEPPPRAAAPVADSGEPMELALSAAATGAIGVLPETGFGGELQFAWMRGWLRIGLAATWFPGRSMQLTDDLRGTFQLYFAELLVCGQYSLPRARAFACATGALGRMSAYLDGPGLVRSGRTGWRAVGFRVGISYPVLPRLELTVSLALVAPLTRPRFYGADVALHEPEAVNAALLVGALFPL